MLTPNWFLSHPAAFDIKVVNPQFYMKRFKPEVLQQEKKFQTMIRGVCTERMALGYRSVCRMGQ